ncbi:MAG: hypothetical protein AAF387_15860 [Pseudomonadota bacterium]
MYRIAVILVLIFGVSFSVSGEGETTRELNSTEITYEYSSGRSYNVKFEDAGVSYRYLSGSKPEVWWGPFPYQAIRVKPQVYFTSWFEKGYGDYVTLLINFEESVLYGSAILRGEEVHFHKARILGTMM